MNHMQLHDALRAAVALQAALVDAAFHSVWGDQSLAMRRLDDAREAHRDLSRILGTGGDRP